MDQLNAKNVIGNANNVILHQVTANQILAVETDYMLHSVFVHLVLLKMEKAIIVLIVIGNVVNVLLKINVMPV